MTKALGLYISKVERRFERPRKFVCDTFVNMYLTARRAMELRGAGMRDAGPRRWGPT